MRLKGKQWKRWWCFLYIYFLVYCPFNDEIIFNTWNSECEKKSNSKVSFQDFSKLLTTTQSSSANQMYLSHFLSFCVNEPHDEPAHSSAPHRSQLTILSYHVYYLSHQPQQCTWRILFYLPRNHHPPDIIPKLLVTPSGQISLDETCQGSPGFHQQLRHWVRTAWQWYRSTTPAPERSPVFPGSHQSTASQRNPRAHMVRKQEQCGEWNNVFLAVTLAIPWKNRNVKISGQLFYQLKTFLSSACTLSTKVLVVTVVNHLLYTFARSARCISWNNVAAVDSRDKETWSLLFHNM